jgi:hypothetical protein
LKLNFALALFFDANKKKKEKIMLLLAAHAVSMINIYVQENKIRSLTRTVKSILPKIEENQISPEKK